MIKLLSTIRYRPLSREAIIRLALVGVLLVPVVYAGSLIATGGENLNALRHLDLGDFAIVDAWVGVYPYGPFFAGPFKIDHIYPKAFYNLAGVFLYPYSAVYGEDFRIVLLVWKGMNAILGAGAVLALYFLIRRVFRSDVVGLIAAGLFASTAEFLQWVTSVRPNPIEQTLIFMALLVCVSLCERFSYRRFLLASLIGALAFASKYGGAPFLFLVPGIATYAVWRHGSEESGRGTEILRQQTEILRVVLPVVGIFLLTALILYGWLFYRHGFDGVALIAQLSAPSFAPDQLGRVAARLASWRAMIVPVMWGVFGGLALLSGTAVAVWLWIRKAPFLSARLGWQYMFLFIVFMVQTGVIYMATFFLTGPAYLMHPEHFVSQVGWMVYYSVFAGSYGSIPTTWGALQFAVGEWNGWGLFLPVGLYALYTQVRDRGLVKLDLDRRVVLWCYILISLVIFLSTKVGVIRHILPAIALLYGITASTVRQGLKDWFRESRLRQTMTAAGVVLLIAYFGVNATAAFEQWEDKWQESADVGFEVGNWLRGQYGPETRILTDKWMFYIPPEFTNALTTREAEGAGMTLSEQELAVKGLVVSFNPEIIVLADLKGHAPVVRLEELLKTDTTLQACGYRLIKQFESGRRGDRFENIRVYGQTTGTGRGKRSHTRLS